MKELMELRGEIDEIDQEIVELYERRMRLAEEVAKFKIKNSKKVLDKERESSKLEYIQSLATTEFTRHGVKELFEQIMAMSRKKQYQLLTENGKKEELDFKKITKHDFEGKRIVYQGAEGAYSQQAMQLYFGKEVEGFHVDTFREAMEAIEQKEADYAVLPIENSTAGIVTEIYDLLMEFNHYIVGEQVLPICHCLLGVKGSSIEHIKKVYSHPQSLMQTQEYLREHGWEQVSMKNNAFAAKKVAQEQDATQGAIASEVNAGLYNLSVLEKGIQDNKENFTRFIIVSKKKEFLDNAQKVSICFEVPHESGSLYHMLSHFIYNNLNMTLIQSRPVKERNWEYGFFVDFEGTLEESSVINALAGLKEETKSLRILGNY